MRLGYTKLQIVLEVVGAFLLLGMLLFLLFVWNDLPERIPTHFNAAGQIDGWGGKGSILIMPITVVVMYALLTVISFFPQTWNLPTKVTEQNKWALYGAAKYMLILMKVEVTALLFALFYFMAKAEPLPGAYLPVFLVLILGTVAFFLVKIIRLGRL